MAWSLIQSKGKEEAPLKEALLNMLNLGPEDSKDYCFSSCMEHLKDLEDSFRSIYGRVPPSIRKEYVKWTKLVTQCRSYERQINNKRDKLASHSEIRAAYFEAILNGAYWFTTDEIELMAHIHNTHVEIYTSYQGRVQKANDFCPTGGETKVLFLSQYARRGSHYYRCVTEIPMSS